MEERLDRLERRQDLVEERLNTVSQNVAITQVQQAHIDKRFDKIDIELASLNGTFKWIARIVIGAIVMAVMAFALQGGFNVGG